MLGIHRHEHVTNKMSNCRRAKPYYEQSCQSSGMPFVFNYFFWIRGTLSTLLASNSSVLLHCQLCSLFLAEPSTSTICFTVTTNMPHTTLALAYHKLKKFLVMCTAHKIVKKAYVAVLCRNQRLFCRVFRLHCYVWSGKFPFRAGLIRAS